MKKKVLVKLFTILFLILTYLVVKNLTVNFDDFIYNKIFSIRNDFFDNFFRIITGFANTIPVIIIGIIFFIILDNKNKFELLLSLGTIAASNQILKRIIVRIRPDHIRLVKEGGYSYPSGHTMISIALYGYLIYLVNKKVRDPFIRKLLTILLVLLIIGIGISRIYLGVHYPTDVIAGYLIALSILIIITSDCSRGNIDDKDGSF